MPDKSILLRAALGAVLIGAGLAVMLSASRALAVPCEDCDDDKVATEPVEVAESD